jgi:phage baseplate assembly protein W
MAFGAKKIFPIDFKPGTAVGVALPFNAPAVFYSTYTTKDAIRTNLINFFLTNQNERYLNPNFGGNLRAFIFQQITNGNIQGLKADIQSQLKVYFSNVNVDSLDIDFITDENQITVSLTYNIINTGISDNINIAFT